MNIPTFTLTFTMTPGFGGTSCAQCGEKPGLVRCSTDLGNIKFYLCDDCAEAIITTQKEGSA